MQKNFIFDNKNTDDNTFLDSIEEKWKREKDPLHPGCILIYLSVIFSWMPYTTKWSFCSFEFVAEDIKFQKETLYSDMINYTPFLWKPEYNDIVIKTLKILKTRGISLRDAVTEMFYGIHIDQAITINNYEEFSRMNNIFTERVIKYAEILECQQQETLSCSIHLRGNWRE